MLLDLVPFGPLVFVLGFYPAVCGLVPDFSAMMALALEFLSLLTVTLPTFLA